MSSYMAPKKTPKTKKNTRLSKGTREGGCDL